MLLSINKSISTSSDASTEFQLQKIPNFITGREDAVHILLVVRRRDAEPSSAGNDRRGWISGYDDSDVPTEHLMREGLKFARMVDDEWDYGRVVMAVYDKSESLQSQPQVTRIKCDAL